MSVAHYILIPTPTVRTKMFTLIQHYEYFCIQ